MRARILILVACVGCFAIAKEIGNLSAGEHQTETLEELEKVVDPIGNEDDPVIKADDQTSESDEKTVPVNEPAMVFKTIAEVTQPAEESSGETAASTPLVTQATTEDLGDIGGDNTNSAGEVSTPVTTTVTESTTVPHEGRFFESTTPTGLVGSEDTELLSKAERAGPNPRIEEATTLSPDDGHRSALIAEASQVSGRNRHISEEQNTIDPQEPPKEETIASERSAADQETASSESQPADQGDTASVRQASEPETAASSRQAPEDEDVSPGARQTITELSNCQFSNDSCSWSINGSPYNHYSWQLGSPSSAFFLGGPATDSSGSSNGTTSGYAFVDGSIFRDVNLPDFYLTAWLSSAIQNQSGSEGSCLRFKYSTSGSSVQALRVLRVDQVPTLYRNRTQEPRLEQTDGSSNRTTISRSQSIESLIERADGGDYLLRMLNVTEIIWEDLDATFGGWKDGHITFTSGYSHRLVFEVMPRLSAQSSRGYAAVDDVTLTEGACGDDCNFEDDLCRWSNSAEDDFDWSMGRGSASRVTGPVRDHGSALTFSRIGGYAVAESAYPRRPGDQAWLESSLLETSEPHCLSFYTSMYGAGVGSLSVVRISNEREPQVLWRVSGGSGSQLAWHLARVTLAGVGPYKVRFVATIGETGTGDIAIDSIRVGPGSCAAVPSSADVQASGCSFLDDMCGWQMGSSSDRLWRRVSGGHTSLVLPYLQPPDHHISFSVDSYQHREGSMDRLVSPLIQNPVQLCFSFWVRMASSILTLPRLGSLRVLLLDTVDNSTAVLWRADNHVSHDWVQARVSFTSSDPVQIALEGIRGAGVSGVMAVDDIVLFEGGCEIIPPSAAVSTLDCSFDEDTCDWSAGPDDVSITWRTSVSGMGVTQLLDHTHRTEVGYLYFDPFNQRMTARLTSEETTVLGNGLQCFSLWYTCIGGTQEDATLSVRQLHGAENGTSEVLWQVTQGQTGAPGRRHVWKYGQVALPAVQEPFRLIIEAIGMQAGFAIDDLRFGTTAEPCQTRPASAVPTAST